MTAALNFPTFDPETGEMIVAADSRPDQAEAVPAPPSMSLDDARALLVREHGVAIGKDDPVLMLVTLHQGFLRDLEKSLARHSERSAHVLSETGESFAALIGTSMESFKDKTVKASLEQSFALIAAQAEAMTNLRRSMRRLGLYLTFLAILSLTGCGLVVSLLFKILR